MTRNGRPGIGQVAERQAKNGDRLVSLSDIAAKRKQLISSMRLMNRKYAGNAPKPSIILPGHPFRGMLAV